MTPRSAPAFPTSCRAFSPREPRRAPALRIAEELESVGGSIDSYCDYDALGLATQTVADDWSLALEILTDCLFHPVFDPIEFDKERSMIQADILRRRG